MSVEGKLKQIEKARWPAERVSNVISKITISKENTTQNKISFK